MNAKRIPKPRLRKTQEWLNGWLVRFPVSYRYNGGVVVGNKWYEGFDVPWPNVPRGFELVDISISLQLNAQPPLATYFLRPKN
jgi:hypothetical protein